MSKKDEVPKPLPVIRFFAPWIASSAPGERTPYPVVSLFSGAMGLDLGLEKAGMDIRIGQDYDKSCVETMQANNHPVMGGDIRALSPEVLLDAARLKVGEPFLICGGPPCQPFSTAGKRLGINDPRGSLFMDFIRMIAAIQPRFFVMENVKGLMSAPLRTDEKGGMLAGGTVLGVILAEFAKLNYKTVFGILDAVNYGVPQFRERFVLIGSRDAEDIFLPVPTHFQRHQNPAYRWRTLGDAIKDLENAPGVYHEFSPERAKFLKMVPPGGNWRSLPPDLLEEAMGGAYKSGGGKVGFYRRLSYAEPCPTVTTAPAQKATMLCHPTQLRALSISEYKRIQQFPDDWKLTGSSADQYRQIGNAVPVGLAKAIGEALIATASGTSAISTKRFRGTGIHNRISQAITLGGTDNHEE
ncbi:MAG: DNA cytosine methyltransferase [Kiritimatiellae bacterium]|nr:DNA cytosine methyltransferase [Kiritimatiellia bacterium]